MQYNRVEVYICGKRYVLQTSDDPEYIKELARQLDKKLNDIFNVDDTISLIDASILVAMEIMDESLKNTSKELRIYRRILLSFGNDFRH